MELLVADRLICEVLVKMGIKPNAILWHVREFNENWELGDKEETRFYWAVSSDRDLEYIDCEVIPAWTFEELYIMMGGDMVKPDLLPLEHTLVRNNRKKKQPFYEYVYTLVYGLSGTRQFQKMPGKRSTGAQACAELLRNELQQILNGKKAVLELAIINERYNFFFGQNEER